MSRNNESPALLVAHSRPNNTQAYIVDIGPLTLFFSYSTLIAANCYVGGVFHNLRCPNHWGPTTGKHFSQLGCKDYPVTKAEGQEGSDRELRGFVTDCIFQLGIDHLHNVLAEETTGR